MVTPPRPPFRERLTLSQRKEEYARIRMRKPLHTPIIAVRGRGQVPPLDKDKYLVPEALTCAQFSYVLRRRLRLEPAQALFLLLCDGADRATAPPGNALLSALHSRHADADGFLYVTYTLENAFGGGGEGAAPQRAISSGRIPSRTSRTVERQQ